MKTGTAYGSQDPACPAGLAGPHAVTSAGAEKFCYDLDGNMIRRLNLSKATIASYQYDAENHLTQAITGTTTVNFAYDADGQLVRRIGSEGTTMYVGPHYEKLIPAPPTPTPTSTPAPTFTPTPTPRPTATPDTSYGTWVHGKVTDEATGLGVAGAGVSLRLEYSVVADGTFVASGGSCTGGDIDETLFVFTVSGSLVTQISGLCGEVRPVFQYQGTLAPNSYQAYSRRIWVDQNNQLVQRYSSVIQFQVSSEAQTNLGMIIATNTEQPTVGQGQAQPYTWHYLSMPVPNATAVSDAGGNYSLPVIAQWPTPPGGVFTQLFIDESVPALYTAAGSSAPAPGESVSPSRLAYPWPVGYGDYSNNNFTLHSTPPPPPAPKGTKYYYFGSQRIAMRVDNGPVVYLYGDHLGSTLRSSAGTNDNTRYEPYGQVYIDGHLPTDYKYTGQRQDSYIKLTIMGSRWYDSELGRFISPDSIVPDPGNPQDLNRYAYARSNPLKYTDPSGHCPMCVGAFIGGLVGAGIAWVPQFTANLQNGKSWDQAALSVDWGKVAAGAAGGAVSGATLGIGTAVGAGALGTLALGGVGGVLGGQAAAATEATWDEAARWGQGQGWDGTRWFKDAAQEGLFDLRTAAFDAAGGVLSAGLGYKLDKVVSGVLSRYGDQTFKGGVTAVYMLPGKGSQGQFGLRWDGRTVILPASEFENMMKKLAGGTFEVSAEALEQLFEKLLNDNLNPSNAGAAACP